MDLGTVGVWWSGRWRSESDARLDVAAEMEALGYTALWSSGGFKPGLSKRFERLLASTTSVVVASGIVSIWSTDPQELATAVSGLETRFPGRFLLGLGVSHAPLVEKYDHPYGRMVAYLDALEAVDPPVSKDRRALAALRPRMLQLAALRAAGAHPYLVPVEHTARARQVLGPEPLLAPEVTAIVERDRSRAHEAARRFTAGYLTLPNYVSNLRSLGFAEDDVSGGGSDRLLDAVVAWGDVEDISARVNAHLEAGADHVCVQVLSDTPDFPLAEFRLLAPALGGR